MVCPFLSCGRKNCTPLQMYYLIIAQVYHSHPHICCRCRKEREKISLIVLALYARGGVTVTAIVMLWSRVMAHGCKQSPTWCALIVWLIWDLFPLTPAVVGAGTTHYCYWCLRWFCESSTGQWHWKYYNTVCDLWTNFICPWHTHAQHITRILETALAGTTQHVYIFW